MPEVTAVIPTRNRWPLLSAAIAGVLRQEDVDVEAVVVDDGSTDETPQRIADLGDQRIRYFRHEQSRGQAQARNRGIAEARGEWLAFHDDDDMWSPQKLRAQLDVASAEDATFAYGAAVVVDEGRDGLVTADAALPDPAELPKMLLDGNAIPGGCSNVIARTEIVRELGGFDDTFEVLSDWDMWLQLAGAGPAAATNKVVCAWRRHALNLHTTDVDHQLRELEHLANKHRSAGMTFDPISYSRWLASEMPSRTESARIYLRAGIEFRNAGNFARAAAVLLGIRPRVKLPETPLPEPDWVRLYR